jgi:hypothetical protein
VQIAPGVIIMGDFMELKTEVLKYGTLSPLDTFGWQPELLY